MLVAEMKSKLSLVNFDNDKANSNMNDLNYVTRMEDVLTSNIFGIIKNIDVKILNAILIEAGIDELTEKFEFEFWKKYDNGTEPDIIIKTLNRYILIEVKYLSDFDKGNNDKQPQIIRELEGAKVELGNRKFNYLAVTKEEEIDWYSKVFLNDEYITKLKMNSQYLHHISWVKIYEALKDINENESLDCISKSFVVDLLDYLEKKEIGYSKVVNIQDRPFIYFFGKESEELYNYIKEIGINTGKGIHEVVDINLNELGIQKRKKLYNLISSYIEELINNNKLRKIKNKIAIDKVPIDLIFKADAEELDSWMNFISFLYKCDYTNLNGKYDISVKLHFSKGNYTAAPVSLFTYIKDKRILEFRENR